LELSDKNIAIKYKYTDKK